MTPPPVMRETTRPKTDPGPVAPVRLDVRYFYDLPLANQLAATIQILRTGAALVDAGHAFTFYTRDSDGDAVLSALGIEPRPGLAFARFYGDRRLPRPLRRVVEGARFAALRRRSGAAPGAKVLMTRGESAFSLLPALERRRPRWPALAVYELHRLAFLRAEERTLGRTASGREPISGRAARLRALERRAVAASDALVCLTPAVAEAVRDAHGLVMPTLILPSGVTPAPAGLRTPPRFDVVYAGKIEARKGLDDLCAAMALLPDRTLGVAGGPDENANALRARLAAQGLADRVTVIGWLPPAEIPGFLRSGRVGVCPLAKGIDSISDRFTSPMKLLEMMALGVPVAATDVGPVRAIATDGVHALLCAPNAPEELAGAIARLLDNPDLAARLAAEGRRRAAAFSWEARAGRLAAFLQARLGVTP
jgi:glycosyltransferase involved in cell wall biosynthesis